MLEGRGNGSLASTWDALRASYWFLPMLMVAAAAALALGLIELDTRMAGSRAARLPWVLDAGPEGARALLSAVAGSTITVTGVVFSITIVALTLASSQFGPRLLRNFLRDRGSQLVLGTFVATFLYSLLVLRAVHDDLVPHLATTGALALAVTSVFVLIYFVHHSASSIQASSVIASVAREIETELPNLFPERLGEGGAPAKARDLDLGAPTDVRVVTAPASGYVRILDANRLFSVAVERDLRVEVVRRPGDFAAEGTPLARVAPAERASDEAVERLRQSFVLGDHRTPVQDLGFLTDQLAEMAVRALSPGVNDPNTAIACLHRLGAVIAAVAGREMPSPDRYDDDGRLRVIAKATTFPGIVGGCLDPIRRYGVRDANVVEAALLTLAAAGEACVDPLRRACLVEHAREWADGFSRAEPTSRRDRARVDAAVARFEKVAGSLDALSMRERADPTGAAPRASHTRS